MDSLSDSFMNNFKDNFVDALETISLNFADKFEIFWTILYHFWSVLRLRSKTSQIISEFRAFKGQLLQDTMSWAGCQNKWPDWCKLSPTKKFGTFWKKFNWQNLIQRGQNDKNGPPPRGKWGKLIFTWF